MRGFKIDDLPKRYQRQVKEQIAGQNRVTNKTAVKAPMKPKQVSTFPDMCASSGLGRPEGEYRFHPTRRWKIDWAWPQEKIALEVEGAAWTQGRHTRGSGFIKDMEKYNELAIMGWRLIRVTPKEIEDLSAIATIERILKT